MRSPYTQNRNRFRFRSRSLDTHDPKQHTLAVQHHLITGHTWPRTVHTYYAASFDHWTHMTQNSIHLLSSIIWSLDTHDPKLHTLAMQHHLITGHTWPRTVYIAVQHHLITGHTWPRTVYIAVQHHLITGHTWPRTVYIAVQHHLTQSETEWGLERPCRINT